MLLEPIRALTPEGMERIHEAALTILAEVGMKMESDRALEYLGRAGCRVDHGDYRLTFPRTVPRTKQGFTPNRRKAYNNKELRERGLEPRPLLGTGS